MASPKKNNKNSTSVVNIEEIPVDTVGYIAPAEISGDDGDYVITNNTDIPVSVEPVTHNPTPEIGIDVSKLLDTISKLQAQVDALTNKKEEEVNSGVNTITSTTYPPSAVVPVPVPVSNSQDNTTKLLEYLTNKKSDKEVTIVHNQELIGGLSTAIQLTGLSIDFHSMGEQRVLSFQQFEECVSKYRNWFNRKIILLSYEDRELADRYGIPYVGQEGEIPLTRDLLYRVKNYDVNKLEDLYKKLNPEDQKTLCTYWIGKCYERESGFYDRYKIECLNRLSNKGAFDNILVNMNNEFMRRDTPVAQGQQPGVQPMGQRQTPYMQAVEF